MNSALCIMPAKPCKVPTVVPALPFPPQPDKRLPLPSLLKRQANHQLSLLLPVGEWRHRAPLYLSPAQQAATRKCKGPGTSSPQPAVIDRPTAWPYPHQGKHFPREGAVAFQPSLSKRKTAPPGENLIPPTRCKSTLALAEGLAALKCFLISGSQQSLTALQRGQTTHKAGKEQREHLPAALKGCLRPGELACAHQHPGPGCCVSHHPNAHMGPREPETSPRPPRTSPAHTEPGAGRRWARAPSPQPLGHRLCHPTWLGPPLGPSPTPGSHSHQSSEHVGTAETCLQALRLSLLTKGANSEGLSQLEEYGS